MAASVPSIPAPVTDPLVLRPARSTVCAVSRPTAFFCALWLAVALCVVAGDAIHVLAGGRAISRLDFPFRGAAYALWVPLVPLIVRIARRFAPVPGRRMRAFIVHFFAGLLLSLANLVSHKLIFCAFLSHDYLRCLTYIRFEPWLVRWVVIAYFVYGATAIGTWLLDALEAVRQRDLLLSRKERELAAAELQIVHGQIPPEYLTSLFEAISARMHEDRDAAERMVIKAADFLRASVNAIRAQEITLADDLALLAAWADVESSRRRLPVVTAIDIDPETKRTALPAPRVQPVVARLVPEGAALVTVTSSRRDHALAVRVDCSNGRGETIVL